MSGWTPSELYTRAKASLTDGERLALRYVEAGIALYPEWRHPEVRRETADGWVLDET